MNPYEPTASREATDLTPVMLFVACVVLTGLMLWDMQRNRVEIVKNAAGEWERVK